MKDKTVSSFMFRILEEDNANSNTTTSEGNSPLISKSHIVSAILGGLFVVILIATVRYLKEKILTSRHERAILEIERNYHAIRRARYNSSMDIQRQAQGTTVGVNRFLRSMELQQREYVSDRIQFVRQYLCIWILKEETDEELGTQGREAGKEERGVVVAESLSLTSLRNKNSQEETDSRKSQISMEDDGREKHDENDCSKRESLDLIQLHSSASCSICYERYKVGDELAKPKIQQCSSHVFHASCLESWLMKHGNCPLCRHDILINEDT